MKSIIIALLFMASVIAPVAAQTPADSAKVSFRLGHRQYDPTFNGNDSIMRPFISKVRMHDASSNIERLQVRSYASPDGSNTANQRLSANRCKAIREYIVAETGIAPELIQTEAEGVAWDELRRMVAADSSVPYRDEVLQVLDTTPLWVFDADNKVIGGRKKSLMNLRGGIPYRWLYTNIFPSLRNAVAVSLHIKHRGNPTSGQSDKSVSSDFSNQSEVQRQSQPLPQPQVLPPVETTQTPTPLFKPFYMSVSTNMLYDALLVPNVGVEFYLGKQWSIGGNWMYGWWSCNNRHRYWRIYGGDVTLRRWFGKKAEEKPLTGHHAGVYGQVLTYDFEFGGKGQMAGKPGDSMWARCSYGAGAEYGYSLAVSRHLNIDFTLGIGYLGGTYYEYHPEDGHYVWDATKKRHWFGPTKAQVSLVWLLGRGNTNKKGGKK